MSATVDFRPGEFIVSSVEVHGTVDQRTPAERIVSFLCRPVAWLGITEICSPRFLHFHGTSDGDGILRDQFGRVCGEVRTDGTFALWPPPEEGD